MPAPVGIALAGLAAATWKEMWELFRQKYGEFGEAKCRELQDAIEDAMAENDDLMKMIDIMRDQLARARKQSDLFSLRCFASDSRANELAARLNEAMCRLERADLPPNPYDEGEPGVPEPTEMDP